MDYINELIDLGYPRCCAVRIANTMVQQGREIQLRAMIDEKKSLFDVNCSIKKSVEEVLG